MKLVRQKLRAGWYQLRDPLTGQLRAEIIDLPDPVNVDAPDHWLVWIDEDPDHHDGCKARTLREAEANARAAIAFLDSNPLDLRSDQQRIRDANATKKRH